MRVYSTDILCVGGGGAAMTAAVAASKSDAKVIIASKGKIGNSGNTIMIGGSYAMDGESAYHKYGLKDADKNYTKENLFESIVKDGFFLSDQNIVEMFVEESPHIVNEVRLWAEEANQYFMFLKPATWVMSGSAFGKALKKGLQKEEDNVTKIEDVIIIELLKSGDKVTGAMGLDIYTGECIRIDAKAVILGTGGFQPFTLKNTNTDMTGDGIAMAYRAGAQISDMEFLLYLVTAVSPNEIKGSIIPIMATVEETFKFTPKDKDGNVIEIPEELKSMEENSEICKLIHLYYFGKTILEGKGGENGGIFYDFSEYTEAEIESMFDKIIAFLSNFYKNGFYHGDDIEEYKKIAMRDKKLEVGLGNEYSVGGIVINEKTETTIKGLYAAGECSSGLFGSNRVADAVVEMIVEGYKAGQVAAEYIKGEELVDNDAMAKVIEKNMLSYFDNTDGINAAEFNRMVEKISDEGLGFIRNEESIDKAIAQFEELMQKQNMISLKSKSKAYNFEWIQAIQGKNRLLCAYIAALMAKDRKESRGLHIRSDYPLVDNDNFLKRVMAEDDNGSVKLTKRAPIVTKINIPVGGKSDFAQFMIDNEMGLENMYAEEE